MNHENQLPVGTDLTEEIGTKLKTKLRESDVDRQDLKYLKEALDQDNITNQVMSCAHARRAKQARSELSKLEAQILGAANHDVNVRQNVHMEVNDQPVRYHVHIRHKNRTKTKLWKHSYGSITMDCEDNPSIKETIKSRVEIRREPGIMPWAKYHNFLSGQPQRYCHLQDVNRPRRLSEWNGYLPRDVRRSSFDKEDYIATLANIPEVIRKAYEKEAEVFSQLSQSQ